VNEGRADYVPVFLSGVGSDEQGAMSEMAGHRRRQVGTRPFAVQVDDTDIAELRRAIDERVEQD
jgi:hypothetical protein